MLFASVYKVCILTPEISQAGAVKVLKVGITTSTEVSAVQSGAGEGSSRTRRQGLRLTGQIQSRSVDLSHLSILI